MGERGKRIALVTGSAKGMGRAIALRLAGMCSGVAVHYLRSRSEAESTAAEIGEKGALSAAFQADLAEENQAKELILEVEKEWGGIDILVNGIGPLMYRKWDELEAADWEFAVKGNLEAAHFCIKAVLPGMRERKWGRIINIGYNRAEQLTSFPNIVPYAAAKTGLLILTRTAAVSEVSSGITVNMVSPGLMEGGALPSGMKISPSQLGRFEDVAEAVAFLATEEASKITGTNLIVAGTWKM
jgi:3-oxoacyl-[acyl-carrier protein] reductase